MINSGAPFLGGQILVINSNTNFPITLVFVSATTDQDKEK